MDLRSARAKAPVPAGQEVKTVRVPLRKPLSGHARGPVSGVPSDPGRQINSLDTKVSPRPGQRSFSPVVSSRDEPLIR